VKRESTNTVGQEPAAALQKRARRIRIRIGWDAIKLLNGGVGDRLCRSLHRVEEREHVVDRNPKIDRVDGEVQQRRTRDTKRIGPTALHNAGRDQVPETGRNNRGQQLDELFEGRGRARFIDVYELVRFETQHFGDIGTSTPVADEITNTCERMTAIAKTGDQREPTDMRHSVETDTALTARSRKDAEGLVFTDGA